jgi:nesprin-1
LHGDLGQVGDWLGQAEALIASDDIPTIMNEETASIISRKLEEHKVKPFLKFTFKFRYI